VWVFTPVATEAVSMTAVIDAGVVFGKEGRTP